MQIDPHSAIPTTDNSNDDSGSISPAMSTRFRGYLPVVVDIETGGFNADTDAMLEIAATLLEYDENQTLVIGDTLNYHVKPFEGANIEKASLEFTGIDPYHPLRPSQEEPEVLKDIFSHVRQAIKQASCKRAILVGHNAAFDQGFLNAATERCGIKRTPFHPFSSFDTATLAGLALGQTVLAKACFTANIEFDNEDAHSAHYDSRKTAELFCYIVNKWRDLGGWPLPDA